MKLISPMNPFTESRYDFLESETKRTAYPSCVAFCKWLLELPLKTLNLITDEGIDRLVEYIGENEHMGLTIPKEDWECLFHRELMEEGIEFKCLVCLTKKPYEDYELYWFNHG